MKTKNEEELRQVETVLEELDKITDIFKNFKDLTWQSNSAQFLIMMVKRNLFSIFFEDDRSFISKNPKLERKLIEDILFEQNNLH